MSLSYRNDSVLGGKLDEGVITQLKNRANILNKRSARTDQELQYLNSVTGWVKVTSAVDVVEGADDPSSILARKNVLLGGTLDSTGTTMRGGIFAENNSSYELSQILGYRPMSGITGFTVDTKNEQGTLRVATINLKVNSVEQLNQIDQLFFRPGMSILVEWGHSIYCSNDGTIDYTVETFPDFFTGLEAEKISEKLEELKKNSSYNYDGMYGFIKNFNWSYNIDGGYDCRIDVVSKGDLIQSLKLLLSPTGTSDTDLNGKELQNQEQYTTNLHIVLNIIKNSPQGGGVGPIIQELRSTAPGFSSKLLNNLNNVNRKLSDGVIFVLFEGTGEEDFKGNTRFIKMSTFLEILNRAFILKDQNTKNIIEFNYGQSDYTTPFYTFPGHFALDPEIAIIPKTSTDTTFRYIFQNQVKPGPKGSEDNDILDIYLNVEYLLRCFSQVIDTQEVDEQNLVMYVNTVLNGLTETFGNVNDFGLHFDEVEFRYFVVDRKVVPQANDLIQEPKSELDLVGLKSQLENLTLTSTLSNNVGTEMAIAAQASSTDLGADMLMMQKWNQGLVDRHLLIKKITDEPLTEQELQDEQRKAQEVKEDVERLEKFLNSINSTGNQYFFRYSRADIEGMAGTHRYLMSKLSEQFSKTSQTNPGGIIPFTLSFTIKGIAGIKIGQAFRIADESMLPEKYKNIAAFVITGISNSLENNRWVTKVDAKMIYSLPYTKEEADAVVNILPGPKGGFGAGVGGGGSSSGGLSPDQITSTLDEDPAPIINPSRIGANFYTTSPLARSVAAAGGKNGLLDQKNPKFLVFIGENTGAASIYTNPATGRPEYMLNPKAAAAWYKWRDEMKAKGIPYRVSSAYRSEQHQGNLSGGPTVATPGTSPHGWGGAMDFSNLYGVVGGSGDPQSNLAGRKTDTYKNMAEIGAKYGWYNPWRLSDVAGTDEMWHFEYWGS